jgi:hypothetical protein
MLLCSALFIGESYGQTCPGGAGYSILTFDTSATGSGNINFIVPLFDPSIGTLYTVQADLKTYLTYNYTLTNSTGAAADYGVQVKRKDILTATSTGNPTYNFFPTSFSTTDYDYVASDGSGVPIGTTNYSQQVYNPRSQTNTYTVPFLGSGSLNLNYTGTTTYLAGGNTDVAISQTGAKDSIRLTIVYNYCPAATLPSTFIKLTAQTQSSNILLAWTSQQILTGGSFELLKSVDGRTYTSVNKQTVNSNSLAGYNYLYKPTSQDPTKAFFRIKQTDQNGNITYSKVITVILPTKNSSGSTEEASDRDLVVYPTVPANFINVFIPSGTNTDEWTISIISLAGRVMQQTKFSKTNLAKVQFTNPLAPGMYIVDACNSRTQEHFKDKIVVQR